MLATILALNLSISVAAPLQRGQQTIVRDSTSADSAAKNAPRRLPVTAAVLASAFRDAATRDLFNRARKARLAQDSSLKSYDSKVRQRLSVYVGIGKLGRDRLVYRHESAARVQWERNAGVRIEVTGARVAIPVINSTAKDERDAVQDQVTERHEMSPIPYFPGSETLWIGDLVARTEVNERELVNPLATGAEAYYTYATGDSVSFRLPDGRTIQLREMTVRPRTAKGNLAVGSLWFDIATGQLVRAAYRLAIPTPMTISVSNGDSTTAAARRISFLLGAFISPMIARTLSGRRRVRIVRRTILAAAQPVGRRRCSGADGARSGENGERIQLRQRERPLNLAVVQVDTTKLDHAGLRSTAAGTGLGGAPEMARLDARGLRRGRSRARRFRQSRHAHGIDAPMRHVGDARTIIRVPLRGARSGLDDDSVRRRQAHAFARSPRVDLRSRRRDLRIRRSETARVGRALDGRAGTAVARRSSRAARSGWAVDVALQSRRGFFDRPAHRPTTRCADTRRPRSADLDSLITCRTSSSRWRARI